MQDKVLDLLVRLPLAIIHPYVRYHSTFSAREFRIRAVREQCLESERMARSMKGMINAPDKHVGNHKQRCCDLFESLS